jgi:hypothetical protein
MLLAVRFVVRVLVALACGASALASAGIAGAAGSLPPLTVSGNQILRAGVPWHFYGVNRDSLEWGQYNWGGCGGDGHFTAADMDAIAAWHVTAVRVPLSEADWLGRRCSASAYRGWVDQVVQALNARGMYAILDLHWTDVGGRAPCDAGCPSGQQPMPDSDSVVFWRQVATRYRSSPGVIFDLFNEPHGVSWACWHSGGCTVTAGTNASVSYAAVGMQRLLSVVRAAGAQNLVLAAGLDWAYDLSGVGQGWALSGANVAYDTHVYTQWHNTVADWDGAFGFLTASVPVVSTEFGSTDCSVSVTSPLLSYFAAHGMSWTIWSWNAPGECSQPSVLADWSGTPLGGQGALIQQTLAALAGSGGVSAARSPGAAPSGGGLAGGSRSAGVSASGRRTAAAGSAPSSSRAGARGRSARHSRPGRCARGHRSAGPRGRARTTAAHGRRSAGTRGGCGARTRRGSAARATRRS